MDIEKLILGDANLHTASYKGKVTRLKNDLKNILEDRDIAEEAFNASRNVVGITPHYLHYHDDLIDPNGICNNKKILNSDNVNTLKILLAYGRKFHFNAGFALDEVVRLMKKHEFSFDNNNKRRFLLGFYYREQQGFGQWPYRDPFHGLQSYYNNDVITKIGDKNILESVKFVNKEIPFDKRQLYHNEIANCRIVALQRHGVLCFINTIPKPPR